MKPKRWTNTGRKNITRCSKQTTTALLSLLTSITIILGIKLMKSALTDSDLRNMKSASTNFDLVPPLPDTPPDLVLDLPDISELMPVDGRTSIHDILPKLMSKILNNRSLGRLIDLGAGVRDDDPTFPFMDAGWEGLLVDGDPKQRAKIRERFPSDKARIDISYILADTIPDLLKKHGFEKGVDLLKIDIDSFDCFVLHSVFEVIRPNVIVMEVNVKFPPNMRMAMFPGYNVDAEGGGLQMEFDSQKRGHVYGCSLAYQVIDLMRPNGYELLHLDWNNAIYVDVASVDGLELSNDSISWQSKYDNGYWNRSNRDQAFSFNRDTVCWNSFTADQVFGALQVLFRADLSHKNHHLYFGTVDGEGQLQHACFDSVGQLALSKGECTLTKQK